MARAPLLEVKNLHVEVEGKRVLKGVGLRIERGEVHALMGPNASGKTSLAMAVAGIPTYRVIKGKIRFEGKELNQIPINERAKLGIGLAFQNPPSVRGVKLVDLLRVMGGVGVWDPLKEPKEGFASKLLSRVGLDPQAFLNRELNVGFSGGERKRSELAQMFAMRPKLMILDEPDSGVDVDSLRLLGQETKRAVEEIGSAVLVITHHRHILEYLKPDLAHVLVGGKIVCSGDPEFITACVEREGYEACLRGEFGWPLRPRRRRLGRGAPMA